MVGRAAPQILPSTAAGPARGANKAKTQHQGTRPKEPPGWQTPSRAPRGGACRAAAHQPAVQNGRPLGREGRASVQCRSVLVL